MFGHVPPTASLEGSSLATSFRSHKKIRGSRGAHLSTPRDPLPSLHTEELQQTMQARISAARLLSVLPESLPAHPSKRVMRETALLMLRIPVSPRILPLSPGLGSCRMQHSERPPGRTTVTWLRTTQQGCSRHPGLLHPPALRQARKHPSAL